MAKREIINTYIPGVPDFGWLHDAKRKSCIMFVLVCENELYSAYYGIVPMPPNEEKRQEWAAIVARSGTKLTYDQARSYFSLGVSRYAA